MSGVLDRAMHRRRCLPVDLEFEGEAVRVHLVLPVGTESVEFVRDARPLLRAAEALRLAAKAEPVVPDALQDAVDGARKENAVFALKWLPRLSPELDGRRADEVATLIANTGAEESPLVQGLAKVIAYAEPLAKLSEEDLLDYPFE